VKIGFKTLNATLDRMIQSILESHLVGGACLGNRGGGQMVGAVRPGKSASEGGWLKAGGQLGPLMRSQVPQRQ
jgi:hypothetical protein